jgi:hypothetical protein
LFTPASRILPASLHTAPQRGQSLFEIVSEFEYPFIFKNIVNYIIVSSDGTTNPEKIRCLKLRIRGFFQYAAKFCGKKNRIRRFRIGNLMPRAQ